MTYHISQFSFTYPDGNNIIQNLHLNLHNNSVICLLGNNGIGKSTILRAVAHSITEPTKGVSIPLQTGYISQESWDTIDINPLNISESFYDIYYQQCQNNLDDFSQNLFDWWDLASMHVPTHYQQALQDKLTEIGIKQSRLAEDFSSLSPGTKKKVLLAMVFATDPKLIIIDEISNHLDTQAIDVVSKWIKDYQGSMIITEHNYDMLSQICQHFVYIPNNKKRHPLNFPNHHLDDVYQSLQERQTNLENTYKNLSDYKKRLHKAIELNQRITQMTDSDRAGRQVRSLKKKLERNVDNNEIFDENDIRKTTQFTRNKKNKHIKKDILLWAKELSYSIGKHKHQHIPEWKVYHGDRWLISGQNGSGKSTLLSLLKTNTEHEQYISGNISKHNLTPEQIYTFNQVTKYPTKYTLAEYTCNITKMMPYEVDHLLRRIGLEEITSDHNLHQLSLGQYIRLQFGVLGCILPTIKLLILDEPGNYLDIFTQRALFEMLESYNGALILITHDQNIINNVEINNRLVLEY